MDARGLFVFPCALTSQQAFSLSNLYPPFSKQKICQRLRAKMTPFPSKKRVSLTAL
jgi:hypothetical protein